MISSYKTNFASCDDLYCTFVLLKRFVLVYYIYIVFSFSIWVLSLCTAVHGNVYVHVHIPRVPG